MKGLTDQEVQAINFARTTLENNYMTRERGDTYFANDDLRQDWSSKEVSTIKEMWLQKIHITEIAKEFDCDPDEIFLLIFDLARKTRGKIKIHFNQLLTKGAKSHVKN